MSKYTQCPHSVHHPAVVYFFQALFYTENVTCWPILPFLLRILALYVNFYWANKCNGVPKLTNIRYEAPCGHNRHILMADPTLSAQLPSCPKTTPVQSCLKTSYPPVLQDQIYSEKPKMSASSPYNELVAVGRVQLIICCQVAFWRQL